MRRTLAGLVVAAGLVWAMSAQAAFNIVPEPAHIHAEQGTFQLKSGERIAAPAGARAQWIAHFLAKKIAAQTGATLDVVAAPAHASIVLRIDPSITARGAYHLDVSPSNVTLAAGSNRGLFWGVETLRQLLPLQRSADAGIAAVQIEDAPRYHWRGMMLDVSRHFYPVSFVEQQLRLMAYYKLNVFHWHLTDDQGWRIQIPQYPKLTSVGAWRTEPDGKRYGGFYTDQQIREVVKYAAERNIMVVPEIEMPGHSSAAIAAYPELSCSGQPIAVPTTWGVLHNVDCVGKESTFKFMESVLDEVTQLFPAPYVNIGGDEVPAGVWADCKTCAALAKAHGFKDDEPGLHSYFVGRIGKYLASKGKTLIGWDEILEGGVSPKDIVEVWHGPQFAAQAMAGGNRVIVAWPFYLDTPINQMTLGDLYRHDPFTDPLLTKYPQKVLGGEAPLWGEHATPLSGNAKLYPRLLAIAEHFWNPAADNWPNFQRRVRAQEAWMATQHVPYGPSDQDIARFSVNFNRTYHRWRIRAERGFPDMQIHYTLDGGQPTAASPAFTNVLDLSQPATVTVAPFRGDVQYHAARTFKLVEDAALGKPVSSPLHTESGNVQQLTDGILGNPGPQNGYQSHWVVWPAAGMNATVDLQKPMAIHSVSVGFMQASGYGAAMPDKVTIQTSTDGDHWQTLTVVRPVTNPRDAGAMERRAVDYRLPTPVTARYVRITAQAADPGSTRIYADQVVVR
ncbi:MAG TPA: family 20 glycosylhydrolase [Rhodanobacteraceae bacterium]